MSVVEQPTQAEASSGREAARLLRQVRSLADMTSEVAAAHDFPTTSRLLLLTLLGALSATRGVIWLYDRDSEQLLAAVARGLTVEGEALPFGADSACRLRETVTCTDLAEPCGDVPALETIRERWPELAAAVPLVVREELIGLLTVGGKLNRQPYSDSEREIMCTLATIAASGIHSHNLINGLQRANQQLIETQEQLVRSEQLATLGATTAGIAHEIGNPLTSIMGYAVTIKDMAAEMTPELLEEFVQPILDESERLKQILEELKDYAKPKGYETEPVTLSQVIEDSVNFTRYDKLFRRRMEVERIYERDPVVLINRSKIKQVLLNLLKNAAQAMTMAGLDRPPSLIVRVRQEGEWALMSVEDNGPGIPPDKLEKIFEPFFTTKGAQGTGLGLDLCRQIIERHHGKIWVDSRSGEGATFTIRLPVYQETGDGAPPPLAAD